jgi:hypothetical protein
VPSSVSSTQRVRVFNSPRICFNTGMKSEFTSKTSACA